MEKTYVNNQEIHLQPQLNDEERMLAELARMAEIRHSAACPDAGSEWERLGNMLQDDNSGAVTSGSSQSGKRHDSRLRLWITAAVSAAAVAVGVLFYIAYGNNDGRDVLVALDHDGSPQQITLSQDNGKVTDLSDKDSVTYAEACSGRTDEAAIQQRLSTPRGKDFKVVLPDGSEVWLNAESSINFPSAFNGGERRVVLNGEAYFKVARNVRKPFVVVTERMTIKVLGTEFNLRSYKEETPHVSLVKGSVVVSSSENRAQECRLKPGQDAWSDDKGLLHVEETDIYSATQWVEGFFYFDDATLLDILRELGRWYNLGVIFENAEAADYKMHFSAAHSDNINETLSVISNIANVSIGIEGKNIVIR